MSFESYLAKAGESGVEIRWDFAPTQIEQLYNLLKEIGYAKYRDFVYHNQIDILKYLSLSPSQRKQKKWVNHPDNLLVRFAALQISEATVELQRSIEPAAHLVDGGSYRTFHAHLAEGLMWQLLTPVFALFEFDGYSNPFFPEKL